MVRALRLPTDLRLASPALWIGLLGLALIGSLGCQNRPGNWRLLNFGRVDRVPPPPTGSLNIPQFGPVMGTPGGASLGPSLPPGPLPPQLGVSPWNSGAANGSPSPTYTQIPERAASPSAVASSPAPGFDARNAPPLLPGGFDPYDTSTIPTFAAPAGGINPLTTTSSPTVPPGAQDGFWPTTSSGAPGSMTNNSRSAPAASQPSQSWFDPSRFQPVNMGGFTTTTAIDNPMIPVTPVSNPVVGAGYYAAPVPVATPAANGSFAQQWQSQSATQQAQQVQLAQQQAQQLAAWQQAQGNGQPFVAPPVASPAMSNNQVLSENSSSQTAENQARMGWAGAAPPANNGGYGASPSGGAGVLANGVGPGQAPPMFSAAGQPLVAPTAAGPGSGWQTGGAR